MPKTGAQRQAAWRQRQLDAAAENVTLRAELAEALARVAELESRPVRPRCDRCRAELACPSCARGEGWD